MIEKYKLVTSNYQTACEMLKTMLSTSAEIELNARPWKSKRSLSANAQQHVWYKKIAEIDGETVKTIENRCKLEHGLPILLQDPEVGKKLDWTLSKVGFYNMTYESKCNFMEIIAVTSIMNTKQHNKFRDDMQFHYNKNGYNLDYI